MNPPDRVPNSAERVDLTKAPIFGWVLLVFGAALMLYLVVDAITYGPPSTPAGWLLTVPGLALALIFLYAGWSFRTDHRYVDPSGVTHLRHGKPLQSIAFASLTRISLQHRSKERQGMAVLVLEGDSPAGGTPTEFAVSPGYPNIGAFYRFLSPYIQANPGLLDADARNLYNAEAPKHGITAAP